MIHCNVKSSLIALLEKLPMEAEGVPNVKQNSAFQNKGETKDGVHGTHAAEKVAIVDAMAEVQSLQKPAYITNCNQQSDQFSSQILQNYSEADEVHLVFDRYDMHTSLKTDMRERRQEASQRYTTTLQIPPILRKSQWQESCHIKTKSELTNYLAKKILAKAHAQKKSMIVSWSTQCHATHRNVSHLCSQQEEADTKLHLHAVDATARGASTIHIHSSDTDEFILALRRYPELCRETNFVTGSGIKRRIISQQLIYEALGCKKAAASPALHAFSGVDNTGSFSGEWKMAFWKNFLDAKDDSNEISALARMGTTIIPSDDACAGHEEFLCKVYVSGTNIAQVEKLRWWILTKKQAQSERLPPTRDALYEAILRAHYQAIIWNNDIVPNPDVPSPERYGWNLEGDKCVPIMTKPLPAPKSVIQFVRCHCVKIQCHTDKCTCRKGELECTDMCGCCDIGETCDNAEQVKAVNMHTDEVDDELQDDAEDEEIFIWIMCAYLNLINYYFPMFVTVFTLHWMLLVHYHNIYYE